MKRLIELHESGVSKPLIVRFDLVNADTFTVSANATNPTRVNIRATFNRLLDTLAVKIDILDQLIP